MKKKIDREKLEQFADKLLYYRIAGKATYEGLTELEAVFRKEIMEEEMEELKASKDLYYGLMRKYPMGSELNLMWEKEYLRVKAEIMGGDKR